MVLINLEEVGGYLEKESISAEHVVSRIQKTVTHNHLGSIEIVNLFSVDDFNDHKEYHGQ